MPTERDVWIAAKVIALSPMIDAPRLEAAAWCGLARSILEEVERGREIDKRISALPRLGPRDN
jgi:hypothetical protein